MAKFDWYQCTFHELSPLDVMRSIEKAYPFALIEPDAAKNGYRVGHVFKQGDEVLARVWWEGNPGVHVITTSANAHKLAPLLRGLGGHQVTRLDACEDWIESGLFDRLSAHLTGFAVANGIKIEQQGDWVRGVGRTLYLGARSSTVRLVLYEKGYECGGDLDWVRMEVRCRPKGLIARMLVSEWLPGDAFGAAQWLVEALEGIGWGHLQAQSIGTVYRPSDDERARLVLIKQYGAVLRRWHEQAGGLEAFSLELMDQLYAVPA
jgi:hypothetical protein